jgi:hypothetical protein
MDVFPDLQALSDAELKALTERKMDEERAVSYRRQLLHGHIDTLRAERANRLRERTGPPDADVDDAAVSEAVAAAGTLSPSMPVEDAGLEPFPDLATLDDAQLRDMIRARMAEETDVSFQRRMLHGHIDLLREEVLTRLRTREGDEPASPLSADDVDRLSAILKHRGPLPELPDELARLD